MFGHVRLNHAKMLSCGSQRAEASSPIAQRPSGGVLAHRLSRCWVARCRYAITGTYPSVLRAWGLTLTAEHPYIARASFRNGDNRIDYGSRGTCTFVQVSFLYFHFHK